MEFTIFATGPSEHNLDEFFTDPEDARDYASAYGDNVYRVRATVSSVYAL